MIVVVNYANEKYVESQKINTKTAYMKGKADVVYSYGPNDIDPIFLKEHKKILSIKRGNGLWLWKPYFIKKTLEKLNYGDIIFYADAGLYFTDKIEKILNKVSNFDIICFDIPLIEEQFTKKKVLKNMDCLSDKYTKSNQIIATYFIIKKTKFVEKFIDEWLQLCSNYDLISPSDNKDEKYNFISHREDQSIFSLLCKKYDIKPFNDISQRYYFPKTYKYDRRFIYSIPKHKNSKLPVILYLHKMPEVSYIGIMKHKISMIKSIFK